MLAHLRAHLAFGHAVWTREVELETIDARVLDHTREFLPTALLILFHDRSDQDVIRILLLDLAKLVEPNVDRSIGDQLDVFKTDHFTCATRAKFAVTRDDVHDFR